MSNKIYDIVIVGGGMAGISAAYRVAPHCSVVILEQNHNRPITPPAVQPPCIWKAMVPSKYWL